MTSTIAPRRRGAKLRALLTAALLTIAGIGGPIAGTSPASATIGTNDYPSNLASAAQDTVTDPWYFYNRECTSFVAWRLNNDNGVAFTNNMNGGHWGNAYEWKNNALALGYAYNSSPALGAVAYWDANYHGAGSAGHVAYLKAANADGSFDTEDFNSANNGLYATHHYAVGSGSWPSGFIHVRDISSGGGTSVPWNFENLDGDAGAIGGNNYNLGQQPTEVQFGTTLHTFYADAANGYLRHAYADASGWHFDVLDGAGGANGRITANLGSAPTVTTYNSALHVFYYEITSHALRHAWSTDGVSWNFETLDGSTSTFAGHSSASLGATPSAVVSYDGTLTVFYYDNTNGNLRHAWFDGTNWHFESLDGDAGSVSGASADVGTDTTSVVFGSTLQTFYRDNTNGNLRHAWLTSTGWHFENLDGDVGSVGHLNADLGYNPAAVVFNSTLQLLYYDNTNGNLRHSWSDATGWHFENLDGDAGAIGHNNLNTGLMPALTVLNGTLQAYYYDATGGNLWHAFSDATGWHFEVLDGSGGTPSTRVNGDVGYDPVAIAYNGHIQLLYYDNTNGNLRHSWSQ